MRIIQLIILVLFCFQITACNTGKSSERADNQKVLVKASGLNKPVSLLETIHHSSHTISQDGTYELTIDAGVYQFEIINAAGQSCQLSPHLELTCGDNSCTTEYAPVCAKKTYVNVCIDSPCTTDVYKTFSNACEAHSQNAWVALPGECGTLEDLAAIHTRPVQIVPLALFDYISDPFTLISSQINGDTLTIVTEVSGGCGTHDITVYVDNILSVPDVEPAQIAFGISHLGYDDCESKVQVTNEFDLLPLKENYRRLFPDASGVIQLGLNELGIYQFEL